MPGLLIIAHFPLATALKAVALHAFPDCSRRLEALDVLPDMSPEDTEAAARALLSQVRNPDALIFTDVFGATPCNVSQRLAGQMAATTESQIRVVAGVNVPMLWRSLSYADDGLDMLVARALAGATQGVMQLVSSRPQNQAQKPGPHDQDAHQHQQ